MKASFFFDIAKFVVWVALSVTGVQPLIGQVRRPEVYRPWFDEVALSSCHSLVVAHITRVNRIADGQRLIRFAVDEVLRGKESDRILVLSSDEGLVAWPDLQKILFLVPSRKGLMRLVVDHVDLPQADAAERIRFLRALVPVSSIIGPGRQAMFVKNLLRTYRNSSSPWVRRILVEEARRLAERRPETVTARDLEWLTSFSLQGLTSDMRTVFNEALVDFKEANALRWTEADLVFPDAASKKSFLASYARFQDVSTPEAVRLEFLESAIKIFGEKACPILVRSLRDPSAAVRKRALALIRKTRYQPGWREILRLVRRSRSADERIQALRTLMFAVPLQAASAVIKLAKNGMKTPEEDRAVLEVLAAINSGEASLFLEDLEKRWRREPAKNKGRLAHLEYIRSDAFRRKLLGAGSGVLGGDRRR
ncbi:MAG TPA: hypothetical protein ENK43_12200 [Planctomycetes bacterium]|nr:hypothetical protein [Planctomycetota bacterium]